MNREEIRKLLGGYATGNLSPAERSALFAAVIEDQELFDVLAREQPLADLLADPAARARLLAALGEPKRSRWIRLWPALAAGAAAVVVALVVLLPRAERREVAKPVQVAAVRQEAPPPAAPEPKPRVRSRPRPKPARETVRREEPPVVAKATEEAGSAVAEPLLRRPVVARSNFLRTADSAALRCALLRLTPDGGYEAVAKGEELRAGDEIRLRIEPPAAGYLHVLGREGQEGWRTVFEGKLEAGRLYFVPAEGNMRLERPGAREFHVLLSAEGPAPAMSERVLLEVR